MKKRVLVLLLIALALALVFSLAACSLLGIGGGGGEGTAPEYRGMTVSSTTSGGTDSFIYAQAYQDVYVTIHLDNPDDYRIASVTLNGKTYEGAAFQSASDKENVIVMVNTSNASGIVTYTLESVKYVDGRNLKDVALTGDKVVRVGVFDGAPVFATVTEKVGFNEIELTVNVSDEAGLIAQSNGSVKVALYDYMSQFLEEKPLAVGQNRVSFDDLAMGQVFHYEIVATYDNLQDGVDARILQEGNCNTPVAVYVEHIVPTYDGVSFDLVWHEDAIAAGYTISEMHLLDGDEDTKLSSVSTTISGLYSNRDYTLVAYYNHRGQTAQLKFKFHTLKKLAPEMSCSNLWVADNEIRFNIMINDPDNVGALVATVNGQRVSAPIVGIYTKQVVISSLTYGQTYDIGISYDYDLNDGDGVHSISESHTVTIDSQTIHQTSCKLGYYALDHVTCVVRANSQCTHELLEIPSTIDGYTVTKVDRFNNNYLRTLILPDTVTEVVNSAFANCKNLTNVTLPQNLSALSEKMFSGCEALVDVTLPATITAIGNEAFYDCKALTSITIPANVVTIGNKAFRGSGLQTLTFATDSKLTSIGDEAFYELKQITELTLPEGVVTIGNGAFSGLNQLTELTIPASVERIYDDAFSTCTRLQNLTFEADSKLYSIGSDAFYRCEALTELHLPSQLRYVYDRAFSSCSGITGVTIPASVYSIGSSAFTSSIIGGGLQELIFEPNGSLTTIGDGAFSNTAIARVTIPSSVMSLGAQAFYNCGSLADVRFEQNSKLQTIGDKAFAKSRFSAIAIPANVTSIGSYAFSGCSYLRTLNFETNVKLQTIGSYAFADCVSLSTVNVPASVVTIGERAFQNSALTTINYAEDGNLKTIGAYAFEGCSLNRIFIPASVVTIGDGVFKGYGNVNAITFEDGSQLQTIGAGAFEGVGVTQVEIPSSVVTIGSGAFKNCSSLNAFTFEQDSKLQSIGANFFEGCNLIAEIVIPASVTSIGEGAFQNLANLRSVQFETGSQLQSIGTRAFSGCSSLPNIILPDGLVELGSSVFYACTSLQWVIMPKSIKTIGNMAIERNSAKIYYLGSYAEWCAVSMSSGDTNYFQEMYYNVYFFYGAPDGHSWRYGNDGNPSQI